MPDETERARRRRLLEVHEEAENAHDLDAIMATFSPDAVNSLNEIVATDSQTTRQVHEAMGFGSTPGVLSELRLVLGAEYFTDDEIVREGQLCGRHTGLALGFPPPSFREVAMPYIAIYRFDAHDLLVSERIKLDLSPLYAPGPTPSVEP